MSQRLVFEQMQKKSLSEILRIVRKVPTISNKRVNRVPVQPAKFGKCCFRTRHLTLSRKQHHAPLSGAKSANGIRWRMMVRVQLFPSGLPSLSSHSKIEIRDFEAPACNNSPHG